MELYYWNFVSVGLTLVSWLIVRLGYSFLPKSWEAAIWHLGFLVYLIAFAVLGWGAIRVVGGTLQGTSTWRQSLPMIGLTFVQGVGTLFFFLILMAEGFNQNK